MCVVCVCVFCVVPKERALLSMWVSKKRQRERERDKNKETKLEREREREREREKVVPHVTLKKKGKKILKTKTKNRPQSTFFVQKTHTKKNIHSF